VPGFKGAWIAMEHLYTSEMAQNFWTAIYAFSACVVVTVLVSLVTAPRAHEELKGLVYSLTERPKSDERRWYMRPATVGLVVLAGSVVLNILFW